MQVLSFLDLFSQTPVLKINHGEKFTSIFGITISLLSILGILATTFYYFIQCFSRTNYKIMERTDKTITPSVKIFENKFGFYPTNAWGMPFPEHERLFSIEAKFWEMNLSKEKRIQIHNITITNCSNYSDEPSLKTFLTNLHPSFKCLDFKDMKTDLYGKYGSVKG